jgi:hypothetical protein
MKVSPGNKALCDIVSIAYEKPGAQRRPQSLFSLLLEIESRLRKEARINAQAQIRQCNISKVKVQKGSMVKKLSRYLDLALSSLEVDSYLCFWAMRQIVSLDQRLNLSLLGPDLARRDLVRFCVEL